MGYRRAFNNDIPLMLLKAPTNTEMSIVSLKKLLSVKQQLYYSCIIKLIIKGFFFFPSHLLPKIRILIQHGFREFTVPS